MLYWMWYCIPYRADLRGAWRPVVLKAGVERNEKRLLKWAFVAWGVREYRQG